MHSLIHSLIHKLHQTNIPPTIIKYIANYIKDRTGYTLHLNATSRPQQFKTRVPQGGVLSPTLFNIYTSDIPKPPKNTILTTYADDMNPAASDHNYLKAQENLQPYLEEIHSWTKENDLILNSDKSTATLFTPDPAEYNKTLNLRINNTLIPTVKNPRVLEVTLDPKLNFAEHTRITKEKAVKSPNVVKALTSTTWDKQKETLIETY